MKLPLVAGGLALSSACSVLYNPNNLGDSPRPDAPIAPIDAAIDGAPDAPADAMIDAPDAMPDAPDAMIDAPFDAPELTVAMATPASLVEGTGSGNGRYMLVLLAGSNLIAPTFAFDMITDMGQQKSVLIIASAVSTDGTKALLAIQVPVLLGTAQGGSKALHLTATQFGYATSLDTIAINGLDEFAPSGSVDTGTLRPLYSKVTFSSATHFFGTAPALIRSTSDISITAAVDVDGIGASPGAHGCASGGHDVSGGCGAGGGTKGAGSAASGNGGAGGFGSVGNAGAGNGAGAGGMVTGESLLLSLTTPSGAAGNRGNGGGGGGAGALGAGGAGGAGAGVLELTADGSITVTGAGAARAKGGDGAKGDTLGGGDGGGGSGGAVLVRAGAGISAAGTWITAPGGGVGATGGVGRVRVDTTTANAGAMSSPAAAQGAQWATNVPAISPTAALAADLVGGATKTYGVYLNGVAQPPATTDAAGKATANLTLVPGINTLCATTTQATNITVAEATRCIQVGYLP